MYGHSILPGCRVGLIWIRKVPGNLTKHSVESDKVTWQTLFTYCMKVWKKTVRQFQSARAFSRSGDQPNVIIIHYPSTPGTIKIKIKWMLIWVRLQLETQSHFTPPLEMPRKLTLITKHFSTNADDWNILQQSFQTVTKQGISSVEHPIWRSSEHPVSMAFSQTILLGVCIQSVILVA